MHELRRGRRGRVGEYRVDKHHSGIQRGVHGRYRVLRGPVTEDELRDAESDAFDCASADQHLDWLPLGG